MRGARGRERRATQARSGPVEGRRARLQRRVRGAGLPGHCASGWDGGAFPGRESTAGAAPRLSHAPSGQARPPRPQAPVPRPAPFPPPGPPPRLQAPSPRPALYCSPPPRPRGPRPRPQVRALRGREGRAAPSRARLRAASSENLGARGCGATAARVGLWFLGRALTWSSQRRRRSGEVRRPGPWLPPGLCLGCLRPKTPLLRAASGETGPRPPCPRGLLWVFPSTPAAPWGWVTWAFAHPELPTGLPVSDLATPA